MGRQAPFVEAETERSEAACAAVCWPTFCHCPVTSTNASQVMQQHTEKPTWVDALEESLLLAIVLFSLITWIVMIGLLGH
jgi:hypothetical protein